MAPLNELLKVFSRSHQMRRAGGLSVALHVTSAPGEALIRKCGQNLEQGLRPVVVTLSGAVGAVDVLAGPLGIAGRIEVFDVEQFLAGNVYELGLFAAEGRRVTVDRLIKRYNRIVLHCETDPSLRIEIG